MKIAIMTQPLGKNYGGIMQAWALQQVLIRLGHHPMTIDRQPNPKGFIYHAASMSYRTVMKFFGKRRVPVDFEKNYPLIFQQNMQFVDQYVATSEKLNSTEKLKEHFNRNNYNAVIVGSDQTWRSKYSPDINNFFLDFLHGKTIGRIAYASSFGIDNWEFNNHQTDKLSKLAKKFDFISVREKTGVELCRKHLGVEATHVLDPTLLLEKNIYKELIGKERLINKSSGVFTYFLDKTKEKNELATAASKELNEPIYSCQSKYNINDDVKAPISEFIMPDIKDWLAGIANAKIVLTDSFHGMVFSIIFDKPFLVINNSERGSARFTSLLEMIERPDCIIEKNKEISFKSLINSSPESNIKLEKARTSSLDFIKLSLMKI